MPRILFINNTSELGAGTSRSLLLLAKHLRSAFQMGVVLHEGAGKLPGALEKEGIPCFILPNRTRSYFPFLIWRIIRGRYDVVYANNFCGHAEAAAWAAALTRRPLIWHVRESLRDRCQGRFIRLASAVIANSNDTAERIERFASRSQDGLFTVPNGVDLKAFAIDPIRARREGRRELGIAEGDLIILNIGWLCDRKNQIGALQAAAPVLSTNPAVHLVFMGPCQDQAYAKALTQHASCTDFGGRVYTIGPRDDVIPFLYASDLLVHSARKEPQGRVILEAMAAGLPVVAYDVGGIRDALVHGETGFLAPFGDASALTGSLQKLISSPELRSQMGGAGARRVRQHFSDEQSAARVEAVIERVLKSRRGGSCLP